MTPPTTPTREEALDDAYRRFNVVRYRDGVLTPAGGTAPYVVPATAFADSHIRLMTAERALAEAKAEGRKAGLEEAAVLCDSKEAGCLADHWLEGRPRGCHEMDAHAIRALKGTP